MVCPDVVRVLHCVGGAGCLVYLHANVTLSGSSFDAGNATFCDLKLVDAGGSQEDIFQPFHFR